MEIVWWCGADGIYYRENNGPVRKAFDGDLFFIRAKFFLAPDQPDYVRWPQ